MRVWLKTIRCEQGRTQRDVADAAGIRQAAYCNIENGRRRPRPDVAKRIGRSLSFSWTRFYDEEEDGRVV